MSIDAAGGGMRVATGAGTVQARHVVIAGGGNIGAFLGQIIEKDHPGVSARIIEANKDRAHVVADVDDASRAVDHST